jgi:glycosyltransferase involved in cell wall biosynthesis
MARVLFIVNCLDLGGAERQLCILAAGLRRAGHAVGVFTLIRGGPYAEQLAATTDVELLRVEKTGPLRILRFFWRAARLIRRFRPDVIHGYMDDANLLAALMRAGVPHARIAWGVRNVEALFQPGDWFSPIVAQLCRPLSWFAHVIITNSGQAAGSYAARGYPRHRMRVIPNGIDTGAFRPDAAGRARVRAEWSIASDELLVGLVGRLAPRKDHKTFLAAAAQLAGRRADVRFVWVGDGEEPYRSMVLRAMHASGLGDRLRHVPERRDMAAVYSAFDLATLSSVTESFPNVVAEAMACGIPCVATDVGDTRLILGPHGWAVPPRDPDALARAWDEALSARGATRSRACRAHIVDHFGVERLVARTAEALGIGPSAGAPARTPAHLSPAT